MILFHLLVLYDLCSFSLLMFFFFGTLGVGYKATRVFDSVWIEYFGGQILYLVLFNLGIVNQWFQ